MKFARNSVEKGVGALSALLLAASCNQILGNQAPGSDGTGGMGGGGAPSDSGGTSTGGSGHSGGTTGSGGADGGCANGTFDHDADADTACQSWSKCQPGQYIFEQGTPTSDRSCKACTTGTFSDGQNATECHDVRDCQPGEYVEEAPTKEDDRQCLPCPDEEYSTEENVGDCSPWTDCGHPWKTAEVGTPVSNAVCRSGIRQFGTALYDDVARAQRDSSGNVYMAGRTGAVAGPSAGELDVYVRKFDVDGELVWEDVFGADGEEVVSDVAVDADGNVAIVGSTQGTLPNATPTGSAQDAFVAKYSSDGDSLWTVQFRLVTDSTDNVATSVAMDGNGNIYVAATTSGGATAKGNYLRKYDSDGGPVWTADLTVDEMASVGFTDPYVTVDESDHAYLVWALNNGGYTVNVAKHASDAPDETAAWTAQFSESNLANTTPLGVAAFGGHVYVAGFTTGDLQGSTAGNLDAYLVRVDGQNDVPWMRQFGTTTDDVALDVAVDASGLVYVVGKTLGDLVGTNPGGYDVVLRQYDETGDPQWTRQWGTEVDEQPGSVAPDGAGNAFVAGYTLGDLDGNNAGQADFFVMLVDPP